MHDGRDDLGEGSIFWKFNTQSVGEDYRDYWKPIKLGNSCPKLKLDMDLAI